MGQCKLTVGDRVKASREFQETFARINKEYVKEVTVSGISEIPLPSTISLMRNALGSSGRGLVLVRFVGLMLSFSLLFLTAEDYVYSVISLIVAFLAYLWLDSVLLWIQEDNNQSHAKWLMLSILATLALAVGIGIPTEIVLSESIPFEPLGFWESMIAGGSFVTVATAVAVFGSYRAYVIVSCPDYAFFEKRFAAVRNCLRSRNIDTLYDPPENPVESALESETKITLLKYMLLLLMSIGISFLGTFMCELSLSLLLALVELVGLGVTGVLTGVVAILVKKGRMLAKSYFIFVSLCVFLVSIPISCVPGSIIFMLLIYAVGLVYLAIAWMSVKEKAKEKPEILGESYYQQHLASLSGENALQFVNSTRDQLDKLILPSR